MRRIRATPVVWAILGFAGGFAAGAIAWTKYQDRHARSLFSIKPRRRFAALSRLAAMDGSVDTVTLLREYVAWERHPLLRRRAESALARLASTLS